MDRWMDGWMDGYSLVAGQGLKRILFDSPWFLPVDCFYLKDSRRVSRIGWACFSCWIGIDGDYLVVFQAIQRNYSGPAMWWMRCRGDGFTLWLTKALAEQRRGHKRDVMDAIESPSKMLNIRSTHFLCTFRPFHRVLFLFLVWLNSRLPFLTCFYHGLGFFWVFWFFFLGFYQRLSLSLNRISFLNVDAAAVLGFFFISKMIHRLQVDEFSPFHFGYSSTPAGNLLLDSLRDSR